jgi:hypothetical protein
MSITPFEHDLYERLSPFFERHGYALLAEKKQFRQTTSTGFRNVILSPAFYGTDTWLDVNFGCRNEQIEQIAQQFLNNLPDFRPDANTLIVSVGKFNDVKYFRYKIAAPDDLPDVCDAIRLFFDDAGFDFLTTVFALPTLDRVLNQQPALPCKFVYNQIHRCYKGLIAARLNHHPQLPGLIETYRLSLNRQTQNPHELANFERLIGYLQHYSAN